MSRLLYELFVFLVTYFCFRHTHILHKEESHDANIRTFHISGTYALLVVLSSKRRHWSRNLKRYKLIVDLKISVPVSSLAQPFRVDQYKLLFPIMLFFSLYMYHGHCNSQITINIFVRIFNHKLQHISNK